MDQRASLTCVKQVVAVMLWTLLLMTSSTCMATSFTWWPARPATTSRVRGAIPDVIRRTINQIQPDRVLDPDFSHSHQENVGSYNIRVTLTYCTVCLRDWRMPNAPILGQIFINQCRDILADMIQQYSRPVGRGTSRRDAFSQGGIRGTHLGVRVEFRVRRVHDELIFSSRKPSPNFVSPPPVTNLSAVRIIDTGISLRTHGQQHRTNQSLFGHALDYDPDDCIIDASYLVADDWYNGEELPSNTYLQSPGEQYRLVMQADCNLVLYDVVNNNFVHFATGTNGLGQNCFLLMQLDCNLVVYDGNSKPMWASNTAYALSDRYNCLLAVEDSGIIRIWATTFTEDYQDWTTGPLWEAGAVAIS